MKPNPSCILTLALCFSLSSALLANDCVADPAEVKTGLLKEVDASWDTRVEIAPRLKNTEGSSELRDKLSQIQLESLSIVKIPLSQALDMLVSEAKDLSLSYVVNGGSDPEVSLNLKATSFAEALDFLLESAGMSYEIRGNTIVVLPTGSVGTLRTRYFPLSQSLITRMIGAELVKAVPSTSGKTDSTALPLYQHSAAESSIKGFFERLGIGWPEGTGMVLADGELIVTHNTRTLDRIEEMMKRLARNRQVEIEARFMEVGEGALNELGVQWNISNESGTKEIGTTGVGTDTADTLRSLEGAFGSTTAGSTGAVAPQFPSGVNLASNSGAIADVTGIIDGVSIRGILTALSQKDGTELLSAPRVTVLSGSTASITVAQEMRYPQSYDRVNTDVGSGTSSGSILTAPTPLDFTTRNVGVEMQVTPYVENDGSITLILQPEVTQFERFVDYGGQSVVINGSLRESVPTGFFQPVFSVRRLNTEVNIPSGSTVLMGGLTREETVKVNDKVPLLGDIPFLGHAFRSKGSSTLKKNLVVFVTARLVE